MRGIVIKKQHTNEHDQLVTCYTDERGKITAIAKSALKPDSIQGMQLDTMNLVDFELINGELSSGRTPIIAGAQSENAYRNIKSSLPLIAGVFFFLEAVDRLVFENQQDERLWDFLVETLDEFNSQTGQGTALNIMRRRQIELLGILGYAMETDHCGLCNRSGVGPGWALAAQGGLVCRDCFLAGTPAVLLSSQEIASLQQGRLTELMTNAAGRSVIDTLFEQTADARFSSIPFLYSVIQYQ